MDKMLTFDLVDNNTNIEALNVQAGVIRLNHDHKKEILVTTEEIEE